MDLLDANDYTGHKTTLVTLLRLEAIIYVYEEYMCFTSFYSHLFNILGCRAIV